LKNENKKIIKEKKALKNENKKIIKEKKALKNENKKIIKEKKALKNENKQLKDKIEEYKSRFVVRYADKTKKMLKQWYKIIKLWWRNDWSNIISRNGYKTDAPY